MRQFPTLRTLEEALADGYRDQGIPVVEQNGRLFARFEMNAESGEASVTEIDISRLAAALWEKMK